MKMIYLITKSSNCQIDSLNSARALGFEPRSKVLETRMLPLHHARIKAKSYSDMIETAFRICCKYRNYLLKAKSFYTGMVQR